MLKLKRKCMLSNLTSQSDSQQVISQKKSNIYTWIQDQLRSFKYSLTDQNSQFYINQLLRQQDQLIVIEIFIKPKIGIFKEIQFRPKMYINCVDLVKRPKIYNDRRIYHPNINIQTLQVIFPQLVIDWNPTKKLQTLMKRLNYIIMQPNISFIPNNQYNKKAGICYHFKRNQYREMVFQNMPITYQNVFTSKNNNKRIEEQSMQRQRRQTNNNTNQHQHQQDQQMMQIQYENSTISNNTSSNLINNRPTTTNNTTITTIPIKKQCQWFDVKSLYPSHIFTPKKGNYQQLYNNNYDGIIVHINGKRQICNIWRQQQQIKLLQKQMKKVHVLSQSEMQTKMQ